MKTVYGPKENDSGSLSSYYIIHETNTITFTTDTTDYLMNSKFEEVFEILFSQFNLHKFSISIHNHPGEIHDKDIIIPIPTNYSPKQTNQLITFIQKTCYAAKIEWDSQVIS